MLIILAPAPARAGDPLEAALHALPGEVHQVASAGRWRTPEGAGFYRVIVARGGYEHVAQRLYLQWMGDGDSERPPRPVTTVGVAEINDAGPFTFSHTVQPVATNALRVTVNARHSHTRERREFVVEARAPGAYTVRGRGARP